MNEEEMEFWMMQMAKMKKILQEVQKIKMKKTLHYIRNLYLKKNEFSEYY